MKEEEEEAFLQIELIYKGEIMNTAAYLNRKIKKANWQILLTAFEAITQIRNQQL
jgi:hypothetical protein